MAGTQSRRSSAKKVPMPQDPADHTDLEARKPFDPHNTTDTSDESGVSDYGKRRRKPAIKQKTKKKKQPIRKSNRAKLVRARRLPEMSDIEYDRCSASPELGECIEVRKPIFTPKKPTLGSNQLTLQTHGAGITPVAAGMPSIVQIHLDAGAAAGGTTINLDISHLVLGKRAFDEIGLDSLPTPDGSTTPTSPTRAVINKTDQTRSATRGPSRKRLRMLHDARLPLCRPSTKGFCELPYEIRIR